MGGDGERGGRGEEEEKKRIGGMRTRSDARGKGLEGRNCLCAAIDLGYELYGMRDTMRDTTMRILRVFPKRTSMTPKDSYAFVGDPPLWRPPADEVHVSVTFSWDIKEAHRLAEAWAEHYPVVRLGGPALGSPPGEFTLGLYVKSGVTFTTRGCNRRCPWCLVPEREGRLTEIQDFAAGHIVQDNNLLQAGRSHIRRVFAMLRKQPQAALFSGGLDARLVDDWVVEELRGLRIKQLFLAADTIQALDPLEQALKRLSFLPRRKLRVYTLVGYENETLEEAQARLEAVWDLRGMPFAQLYQPFDHWVSYDSDWKRLARTWSRPAAMKAAHESLLQHPSDRLTTSHHDPRQGCLSSWAR